MSHEEKQHALFLRMSNASDAVMEGIAQAVFAVAIEGVEVHLMEQKKLRECLSAEQRKRLWSDVSAKMVASVRKHYEEIFVDRILAPLSDTDIDLIYRLSGGDYFVLQQNAEHVREISTNVRTKFDSLRETIVDTLKTNVARTFKPLLGALAMQIETLVAKDRKTVDEDLAAHMEQVTVGQTHTRTTDVSNQDDDDDSDADADDKAKVVDWEGVD